MTCFWRRIQTFLMALLLIPAAGLLAACTQGAEETVVATVSIPETTAIMEETEPAVVVAPYSRIENAAQTDIRDITTAALMLEGKPLLCVTEAETVQALGEMFVSAQALGYEPQTYLTGIELLLIREDGMVVEVELGLLEDLCRINGEFYDYGPGMEGEDAVNGMERLYELLGLTEWTLETLIKWPVEVAQRYDYLLNSYLNDPKPVNSEFRAGNFLPGRDTIVIRMADGLEIPVGEDGYLDILRPLMFAEMGRATAEDTQREHLYEIEIIYQIGNAVRKVYYLGENQFLIRIEMPDFPRYKSCGSPELAEAVEALVN